jgi:hypothetical protein
LTTCLSVQLRGGDNGTHTSTHGTDHDNRSSLGHKLRCLESTEPSAHDIDVEQLSDLLGRVVMSDVVLDDTSGSNEGLSVS